MNWITIFQQEGAVWIHDGKPARPHALLTSGLHSNGFVNCTRITQNPALLDRILESSEGLKPKLPTGAETPAWVVGSALGAVTFAYAVARATGAKAAFTEKDGDAMKLARFEITPGRKVLVVEDVISTGGSTLKTLDGIRAAGVPEADILPYILCLVNRSGAPTLAGREIRSLVTPDIGAWQPEACPFCKLGSQVVRPKSHWNDLTREYA